MADYRSPASEPIVDLQNLRDSGTADNHILQMISYFIPSVEETLEECRSLVSVYMLTPGANTAMMVQNAAHKLRGQAGILHAKRLMYHARELENAARDRRPPKDCVGILNSIVNSTAECIHHLRGPIRSELRKSKSKSSTKAKSKKSGK